ncbi:hypothetical protein LTR03_006335 [Friedmanniomyces endolithicus]|nr:hypothetical protein LTR03_006335 [Friedmanniomyces endolithicus]
MLRYRYVITQAQTASATPAISLYRNIASSRLHLDQSAPPPSPKYTVTIHNTPTTTPHRQQPVFTNPLPSSSASSESQRQHHARLQKGRWTPEYCTVLHLLFANPTYRSKAAQRVDIPKIFRHLFASDLAVTHPDGVTDNQIADYYRSRKCAGRSKNFQAIEAAELSDEQLALVARLTPLIRTAVEELRLEEMAQEEDVEDTPILSASEEEAGQVIVANSTKAVNADEDYEDRAPETSTTTQTLALRTNARASSLEANPNEDTTKGRGSSAVLNAIPLAVGPTDRAGNGTQSIVRTSSNALANNTPMEPAMLMIHFHEFTKHSGDTSQLVLVDPESETYKLGGKVYRLTSTTDGTAEDLLVCNMPVCLRCKDDYIPKTVWDNEEGLLHEARRVEGLPFVHTADCFRGHEPYWYFDPQTVRPYRVGFPPRMWRTRVAFRIKEAAGGHVVKNVMMCDTDQCPDCKTVA